MKKKYFAFVCNKIILIIMIRRKKKQTVLYLTGYYFIYIQILDLTIVYDDGRNELFSITSNTDDGIDKR